MRHASTAGLTAAGQEQRFHYRRSGSDWRIAAIGRAGVPAGWKPAPGPATPPYHATVARTEAPGAESIEESFSNWLSAWLSGNVSEGIRLSTESVRLQSRNGMTWADSQGNPADDRAAAFVTSDDAVQTFARNVAMAHHGETQQQ